MDAIVFTVQTDVSAFSAAMDVRLGYPKDGVNVGGGFHVDRALSRTLRHGLVIQHPVLPLYRYPADADTVRELGLGLQLPASASIQVLNNTWFPSA